jgi:hypothetical protein
MATVSDLFRRVTTFLLALFLWLRFFFLANLQSSLISRYSRVLRLRPSELLLFALLLTFSFLAGSGLWKTIRSLAYIYVFPLVVLAYVVVWCFLILRAVNRWFEAQATPPQLGSALIVQPPSPAGAPLPTADSANRVEVKKAAKEVLQFLLRPFRRFMLLWCILLVVTTHIAIVWMCLVVVLVQLARQIFVMIKLLFFSPWVGDTIRKFGPALLAPINNALAALAAMPRDAEPTNELRVLWNQLNIWTKILEFLKDRYLLSRWAWVLTFAFLLGIYTYVSLLFSFAYYGIARVGGIPYSWPEAAITSMFIPLFFSDLPKMLAIKLLSGVQCVLVLGVGIGTIVNFLGRKLEAVRVAATEISERFADQSIQEKYVILQERFSAPAVPASNGGNDEKVIPT